jgi:hypothetical protein
MNPIPGRLAFSYAYSFKLRRNRYLTEIRQSLAVSLDSNFELNHLDLRFDGANSKIIEQVKRLYVFKIERPNPRRRGKFLPHPRAVARYA